MTEDDIARWAREWQAGAPPAPALVRQVARERRLLLGWIVADWVVGAALIGFAGWLWLAVGTQVARFVALMLVVLVGWALAFVTRNWRGALQEPDASAAEYLALARRRSAARIRYVRFGWGLLVADLAVIGGALVIEAREHGTDRVGLVLTGAAIATAVAAAVLLWWGRRERARARRLDALAAQLAGDDGVAA